MNEVIRQSLGIISDIAEERKVKVEWQSLQALSLVSVDAARMKQALLNLLMNAIEASSEGETVTVRSYQKWRKFIVDVSDQGCGVPVDKREDIFSPFFTTKEHGTGLGLPITKKIVEAHNGSLGVLENRQKGAIFRIMLHTA
jgi:C4-dicarboxylate-specific signal transduction histidine kinase